MLENALFAFLTCLENYRAEFIETYSVDAFWDKIERFIVWGQKGIGQEAKGPAGGAYRA